MTIDAVEALGDAAPLQSLDKASVARNLRIIGVQLAEQEPTQLAAGQRAILFLWVPVSANLPRTISHRVRLHIAGVPRTYLIDGQAIAVTQRPACAAAAASRRSVGRSKRA